MSKKFADWCFTWNNYTSADEEYLNGLNAQYIIYGKEVGETGTPHLQGYVYFESRKTYTAVIKLLRGCHVQERKASDLNDTIDYCKKDRDFVEIGKRPVKDQKARAALGGAAKAAAKRECIRLAELGQMEKLKEDHPADYLQYKGRLESLFIPINKPIDGTLQHEWWVGTTGTGKSRLLWELYPNHFPKKKSKWWDGYARQEVVAIEEWSPDNKHTSSALKEWADRYPFSGEVKCGIMHGLRPTKLIVISNYTIEQCFDRREDWEPMLRKFKVIKFPEEKQSARFRAAMMRVSTEENADIAVGMTVSDSETESEDELPSTSVMIPMTPEEMIPRTQEDEPMVTQEDEDDFMDDLPIDFSFLDYGVLRPLM